MENLEAGQDDPGAADESMTNQAESREAEVRQADQPSDQSIVEHALHRAMSVRAAPETFDAENRTVEIVISTGATVRRMDFFTGEKFDEELAISRKAVRMDRLNRGAPLLNSHHKFSVDQVIGAIVPGSARIENNSLIALAQLSRREDAAGIVVDVADGILRNVSVGYFVHKFEVDDTKSPPIHRATDWEPFEVSFVPVGADPEAGVRALQRAKPANHEETIMAATTKAGGKPAQNETHETTGARSPEVESEDRTSRAQTDVSSGVNIDDARAEARREERERIADINDITRKLHIPEKFAEHHVREGTSLDGFRKLAIDEAARIAEQEIDTSIPASQFGDDRVEPTAARKPEPGEMFARIIRVLAASRGAVQTAREIASREWNDERLVRALGASTGSAGGFLVPEQFSAEIIELLRSRAVVRLLSPTVVPMPGGNITMPKITGGGSASYVGENQNIAKTEQTTGQIRFTARKLAALVPISNDLLRFASTQADAVVRDDLIAAVAQREDLAFIRDDGSQDSPKGLRYWAPAANLIAANATINLANVTSDLGKLVTKLKSADVRMIRPGWLFSPRTEQYLMTVRDGNGNFAFRAEMLAGRLWGWPFGVTTQIPENLGAGSDESEVYIVDFADAVIAEVPGLLVDASSEAAYFDGSNVVAAFSLDQTVIRVIEQHDFGMRHDASVAVLTAVKWAA